MFFKQINDKKLAQNAYLIGCQAAGEAIIIDPMRDIDQYKTIAAEVNLQIVAAADTHIHADYISGLRAFAEAGTKVYASGEGGADWQYEWILAGNYDAQTLSDGDTFSIGSMRFDVCFTPGHTPESLSFLLTDTSAADEPMGILSGDFVFVGDVGRPDLLETAAGKTGAKKPAARSLFRSVERFKTLPDFLQVWPAHGAGSACGKSMNSVPESTVGYEKRFSPAFKSADSEAHFVNYILDGQPEPPLYFGRMKELNQKGAPLMEEIPQPRRISIKNMSHLHGIVVDTRANNLFMNRHLPGALMLSFDKNFNTIAGSYLDPEAQICLIIDDNDLEHAVRDLVRVGIDNITGYVTPDDLDHWDGRIEQIPEITFDDLEQQRKQQNTQVLDVRKATEYENGHVPDAINIAHTRLAAHLDELPRDKELLVHCGSGQRASYASSLLAWKEFDVQWVNDNFSNWEEK